MTDRCPLLLKYKMRDCHRGKETEIDANARRIIWDWKECGKPVHGIYQILLPEAREFLTCEYGFPDYFWRFEFHAVGDPNPVAIKFNSAYKEPNDRVRVYRVPESSHIEIFNNWNILFTRRILPMLHEYERCQDQWEPRIFIMGSVYDVDEELRDD